MHAPTILVVDDEQLIRWSLTTRLAEDGYRLLEAATAPKRSNGAARASISSCSIIDCLIPTAWRS
jgi:DNA-binding NtrC family response regulator